VNARLLDRLYAFIVAGWLAAGLALAVGSGVVVAVALGAAVSTLALVAGEPPRPRLVRVLAGAHRLR
jgi:hypothetical protein